MGYSATLGSSLPYDRARSYHPETVHRKRKAGLANEIRQENIVLPGFTTAASSFVYPFYWMFMASLPRRNTSAALGFFLIS